MSTQEGSPPQIAPQGPPYAPTVAQLGGRSTVALDVPISAVLLVLFLAGAVTNMVIFQINRKRGHKFIFSVLLFGFCMARITTLSLRIAWAVHPLDVNLAIAAGIFVQAGVLLLFIVNLIFAQRIVRSYHPRLGWSKGLGLVFKFLYLCVAAMLIMVITATVYTFFTLDVAARQKCRKIQLFAGTFLALLAFLPIPITLLTLIAPRSQRPEKFGIGKYRTKISLLLFTSLILSLGAAFRIAVNFTTPRPATDPAWYQSKACFYCFNFVIELVVVYLYAAARFDRRFHVPDGSQAPGHYSGSRVAPGRPGSHGRTASPAKGLPGRDRIGDVAGVEVNRECDVFGDDGTEFDAAEQSRRQSEWESRAAEELKKEAIFQHV